MILGGGIISVPLSTPTVEQLYVTPEMVVGVGPQVSGLHPFLTACITIIGGVVIYVVGQIILKFVIEPMHEQRLIVGEISDKLMFYGNKLKSYNELQGFDGINIEDIGKFVNKQSLRRINIKDKIADDIRGLGSKLVSKTYLIPMPFRFWQVSEKNIILAKKSLTILSNLVGFNFTNDHMSHIGAIRKSLNLIDPDLYNTEEEPE